MNRPSFAKAWNRLSFIKTTLIFLLPLLLWNALFHSRQPPEQTSTDQLPTPCHWTHTPCHWTHTPPVIDGIADDTGWNSAPLITNFRTPWLPTADASTPTINTQAKLLWDNEYLYVWAKLEDKDFQAYITERDGQTWLDDCFEVFLKPTEQHPGYYEFHVTPANTQMDLYIPERHRRAYAIYKSEHDFEFQSAVHLDGSIEPRTDVDTAWQVEFKIAWKDFWRTGGRPVQDEIWSYSLCRYDYDQSLNKPNLTTISPLSEPSVLRTRKPPREIFRRKVRSHPDEHVASGWIPDSSATIYDPRCRSRIPDRPSYPIESRTNISKYKAGNRKPNLDHHTEKILWTIGYLPTNTDRE